MLRKRRLAHIAQHAVTNALVGHCTQLLLDASQACTRRDLRREAHWKQATEPADGAAQISLVEQVFTAMPFQLDQHRGLLAPFAEDLGQRRQQQVVDVRAVRGRRDFQQLVGQVPAQP